MEKEICPFCHKKTMTLMEEEKDIPYFGKVFLFSMDCENCNFYKSDVEAAELQDPCKITFVTESEEDLKVRVVKSSSASISMPTIRMSQRPGPASIGFISNIEGLINRFQRIIEGERDNSDDKDARKKAKNLLKKLRKIKDGEIPLKIVIEDPSGNSAIISDRTVIKKMKVKK
ncbi:MAG: ZPR1 zinc finger domain-containing protein [Nanoarchaeota archaeon]|nr:ZPR1 zinc finger domain-containing protein [Nanoarchaeota archaeon]